MLVIRVWKNVGLALRLVSLSFLIVILVNCTSGFGTVEGYVTSVEGEGIMEIKSFAIEKSDGGTIRLTTEAGIFDLSSGIELTPSHLREHMLWGHAVSVRYYESDDVLIAISIEDVR
ncbi:MAG: hypothetical protein DK304_000165 [Chloroflexi bacterium]|jgi:hypothetical protein|nr:MAG: hypothetical protein DK304_000165 [Chloroflexota bacterium]